MQTTVIVVFLSVHRKASYEFCCNSFYHFLNLLKMSSWTELCLLPVTEAGSQQFSNLCFSSINILGVTRSCFSNQLFIPGSPLTCSYVHSSMTFRKHRKYEWNTPLLSPEMGVTFLTHFRASIYPGKSSLSMPQSVFSPAQAPRLYKIHTWEIPSIAKDFHVSQWAPGLAKKKPHTWLF